MVVLVVVRWGRLTRWSWLIDLGVLPTGGIANQNRPCQTQVGLRHGYAVLAPQAAWSMNDPAAVRLSRTRATGARSSFETHAPA